MPSISQWVGPMASIPSCLTACATRWMGPDLASDCKQCFQDPWGMVVRVSVFHPMADESADPADRRFIPALGGVQQEGQSGSACVLFSHGRDHEGA